MTTSALTTEERLQRLERALRTNAEELGHLRRRVQRLESALRDAGQALPGLVERGGARKEPAKVDRERAAELLQVFARSGVDLVDYGVILAVLMPPGPPIDVHAAKCRFGHAAAATGWERLRLWDPKLKCWLVLYCRPGSGWASAPRAEVLAALPAQRALVEKTLGRSISS